MDRRVRRGAAPRRGPAASVARFCGRVNWGLPRGGRQPAELESRRLLDASALIDVLLDVGPSAHAIRAAIVGDPDGLAAPHLVDAEVGQVRRHVLRGEIPAGRAAVALDDLAALPIVRHAQTALLPRALELEDDATTYDALYLALAEALGATPLTCDAALRDVPGTTASVRVI